MRGLPLGVDPIVLSRERLKLSAPRIYGACLILVTFNRFVSIGSYAK